MLLPNFSDISFPSIDSPIPFPSSFPICQLAEKEGVQIYPAAESCAVHTKTANKTKYKSFQGACKEGFGMTRDVPLILSIIKITRNTL